MKIPLKEYLRLLALYLRPQWARALGLAALLFGSIGLQLASPQIMRRFLDVVQGGGATEATLHLALLFVGVALVQQLVAVLATYVGEDVGWTATNALRADLAEHCLRLDLGFQSAHAPGEMIERIDGDVTTLSNFFSQFVLQVLGGVLLLGGVLALLWREDWRVGLALSGFAIGVLLIMARLRSVGAPRHAAERQASAELFGFLEERLAGMEDIRASGSGAYVMRRFYALMRAQMQRALGAALTSNILFTGTLFLFALGTALAFAAGAYLFERRLVTIGAVYLIFRYTTLLEQPIDRLTHQLQDLQRAGAGVARVLALLGTPSRIRECGPAERVALPTGPLAVSFQGVSFGYDDQSIADEGEEGGGVPQTVLHEVSFTLAPGTVLGVLGRTGSGKTTLTRLLFRFHDPASGAVCLGSGLREGALVDIRRVPLLELRQRIGMVTQNVQLFQATVRDNLTFFDRTISAERMSQVIAALGLEGWLGSLAAGLDTVLEAGAGGLSAGQAQLLALARVLLHEPGLVILDEASSRLDPATERLVARAVDHLLGAERRTAMIIAHRLETVQRADQIMILEGGRIVEYGARAALAADPGSRFYRLLQTGLEEVLA